MIQRLTAAGLTLADVAAATGAQLSSVRAWERGDADPRTDDSLSLQRLDDVAARLLVTLTPAGVGQWVRSPNRYLDGARPLELIRRGRHAAVDEAVDAFLAGSYL